MPRGPHGAISGILPGGILGFGTADWFLFLHLHRDLAVMSGWLCCCFLQDLIHFFNSLAHKLPFSRRARPSVGCFFVCFVLFFFGGCFCFGWSSFFLFDTPDWTCWTVYWSTLSFDSPMRDIQDFAQFVQWHKHCVTTWREPRRRRTAMSLHQHRWFRPSIKAPTRNHQDC